MRRFGMRWLCGIAALGASCVGLLGCEHGAYAEKRFNKRNEHLAMTARWLAHEEARRPALLERDLKYLPWGVERDAAKLDRNSKEVWRSFERDTQQFIDNQPKYVDEILRALWGKPQNIEKNAIDLFY